MTRPATPGLRAEVLAWGLRALAPVGLVLGALLVRLWVRGSLTLHDLPGPGGVKVIAALGEGNTGRDWTTWLVAATLPWVGGDLLVGATLTMVAASVAAVVGATLSGWALGGRSAALAAGALAALWSQAIHPAVVIGADGVAMGASWLGVGLVLWGAGRSVRLPAVLAGAGCLHFALLVKVTAAPVVVLVALAPLVAGSLPRAVLVGLVGVAVGATASLGGPGSGPVALDWPRGAAERLLSGHPEGYVFGVLLQLSIVAALVPGRRWGARLAMAAALVVTLDIAADTGGVKARPRHLATAGLGLVVLAGWLVGAVPAAVARALGDGRPGWLQGSLRTAALAPVVLVGALLVQDSLGFFHGWAALRSQWLVESGCTLPRPEPAWSQLYGGLSSHAFTDHSDPGADVLVELARTAPPGGVATVVLRDNREFHLLAGAALGGRSATVLDPAKCCRGTTVGVACARSVVAALDRAGARVVLPSAAGLSRTPRVNHPHDRFLELLERELDGLEGHTRWWRTWTGSGSGGALPCGRGPGR